MICICTGTFSTNFYTTGMNLAHCSRQFKSCFKIHLNPVRGVLCWASRRASGFAHTGQRVSCNMVHWLWNHTVSQMDSWHAGPKSPQLIWHVCPTWPWHFSPSGSATIHRCPCVTQQAEQCVCAWCNRLLWSQNQDFILRYLKCIIIIRREPGEGRKGGGLPPLMQISV